MTRYIVRFMKGVLGDVADTVFYIQKGRVKLTVLSGTFLGTNSDLPLAAG